MIVPQSNVRVWLATGTTDMRRGMNRHASRDEQPGLAGAAGAAARSARRRFYVFRGKRGDFLKILWHDGLGMSPYAKRLERIRFIWSSPVNGALAITSAQLDSML